MAYLQKRKIKDFEDATVRKQVLWSYVLKNLDIETLLQKIGSLSCILQYRYLVYSFVTAQG